MRNHPFALPSSGLHVKGKRIAFSGASMKGVGSSNLSDCNSFVPGVMNVLSTGRLWMKSDETSLAAVAVLLPVRMSCPAWITRATGAGCSRRGGTAAGRATGLT